MKGIKLFVAGIGERGQLGLGPSNFHQSSFTSLPIQFKISKIATGSNHDLLLSDSGDLYTFGRGDQGQLGHGTIEDEFEPKLLRNPPWENRKIVKMAGGGHHTIIVVEDGAPNKHRVYSWGRNAYGQLGLNFAGFEPIPIPQEIGILRGINIASVACGEDFSIMTTGEGDILAFGKGDVGQTGVGPSDHIVRPYGINKFSDEIFQVSCGWGHTLAASNKQILSWGSNLHGQCGQGEKSPFKLMDKVQLISESNPIEISCGSCHSMVLTSNKEVYLFGSVADGKMTSANTSDVLVPYKMNINGIVSKISAGTDHLFYIANSTLYGWGFGQHSVLGTTELATFNEPQKISLPNSVKKIIDVSSAMDSTLILAETLD